MAPRTCALVQRPTSGAVTNCVVTIGQPVVKIIEMFSRPRTISCALALAAVTGAAPAAETGTDAVARAKYLWSQSPHGKMLERILPPSIEPGELPEPGSEGARLTARYCVQCHYLPNPQMHTAARWQTSVERMVWRMRGKGNLGEVMKEMMERVEAPSDREVAVLTAYLQKHGQAEMDPAHPALKSEAGQRYGIACSQCHELPDPRRHTAREWPGVVERMKRHMAWANTVSGAESLRTTPVLDTAEIVRFLQRHARAGGVQSR
jgi:cytochrome c2